MTGHDRDDPARRRRRPSAVPGRRRCVARSGARPGGGRAGGQFGRRAAAGHGAPSGRGAPRHRDAGRRPQCRARHRRCVSRDADRHAHGLGGRGRSAQCDESRCVGLRPEGRRRDRAHQRHAIRQRRPGLRGAGARLGAPAGDVQAARLSPRRADGQGARGPRTRGVRPGEPGDRRSSWAGREDHQALHDEHPRQANSPSGTRDPEPLRAYPMLDLDRPAPSAGASTGPLRVPRSGFAPRLRGACRGCTSAD